MYHNEQYGGVPNINDPMQSHVLVRKVIHQIVDEVSSLSVFEDREVCDENSANALQVYEDLLASAIINKVVYDYQLQQAEKVHEDKRMEQLQTTNVTEEVGRDLGKRSSHSIALGESTSMQNGSLVERTRDDFMIASLDNEDEVDSHWEGLDHLQYHKVKLPTITLGLDDQEAIENWYFKNEQNLLTSYTTRKGMEYKVARDLEESVYMYVPEQMDIVKPRIGDRDVDEIIELAEADAIESTFDFDIKASQEFHENNIVNFEHWRQDRTAVRRQDKDHLLLDTYGGVFGEYHDDVDYMRAEMAAQRAMQAEETNRSLDVTYASLPREISKESLETSTVHSEDSRRLSVSSSLFTDMLEDGSFSKQPTTDPAFRMKPRDCLIKVGEPVRFKTRVKGTQPIDVFWYRVSEEGTKELDGEQYHTYCDEGVHYLEIYDTSSKDAGEYMCVAVNEMGECSKFFMLNIRESDEQEQAPQFKLKLRNQKVTEGGPAEFMCIVTGYPIPSLNFYRNGKRIANCDRYTIESLGGGEWTLVIHPTTLIDNAMFMAVTKNRLGKEECSANLTVVSKGKKSASLIDLSSRLADIEFRQLNRSGSEMTVSSKEQGLKVPPRNKKKLVSPSEIPIHNELQKYYDEMKAERERQEHEAYEPARHKSTYNINIDNLPPPDPEEDESVTRERVTRIIEERTRREMLKLTAGKMKPVPQPERPWPKVELKRERPPPMTRTQDDRRVPYQEFEKIFYGGEENVPHPLVGDHVGETPYDIYITEGEARIDCGLKSIKQEQYLRDYYVQGLKKQQHKPAEKPSTSGDMIVKNVNVPVKPPETEKDISIIVKKEKVNKKDVDVTVKKQPAAETDVNVTVKKQLTVKEDLNIVVSKQPIIKKDVNITVTKKPATEKDVSVMVKKQPRVEKDVNVTIKKQAVTEMVKLVNAPKIYKPEPPDDPKVVIAEQKKPPADTEIQVQTPRVAAPVTKPASDVNLEVTLQPHIDKSMNANAEVKIQSPKVKQHASEFNVKVHKDLNVPKPSSDVKVQTPKVHHDADVVDVNLEVILKPHIDKSMNANAEVKIQSPKVKQHASEFNVKVHKDLKISETQL
ncbi:PREDICTED: titin-like [Priapulus caudatus]|uniref:Titin-like n=1 Tax=Priapulus caudatus TaxID=37621 RepID=A0ABM1EG28_PRICU|nr:PREDICTED: titin-like [Priapulus caudatus]